ncbi:hypothetical protein BaRGS_00000080 [Batillaria attramentaria]|uniref:Uncharacterized protein n=1 Tax=Batillaria attramentaria TaxID=370345 RepID=A0ABD0M9M5_9CAEN
MSRHLSARFVLAAQDASMVFKEKARLAPRDITPPKLICNRSQAPEVIEAFPSGESRFQMFLVLTAQDALIVFKEIVRLAPRDITPPDNYATIVRHQSRGVFIWRITSPAVLGSDG